nr:MAG TPA: hypothetical protein [Caudoviricetes sp.]
MRGKSKIEDIIHILSEEGKAKEEAEEKSIELPEGASSDLIIDYLHTQIEKQKEEIESLKQDRGQRKTYSNYIFGFMCFYMLASLVAVFFKGFGIMDLSDGVVISLMTTSLASVIGVFNFVAKYLFHPKG